MQPQFAGDAVGVRFFMPSPALAPYVSTYYLTEVSVPAGTMIEDYLHPEWGNLRFARNDSWRAAIGAQPLRIAPRFIASGPSSHCSHFVTGTTRIWGIGILPLGWARFFDAPASDYADDFVDAAADPVFTGLAGLPDQAFADAPDPAAEARRIDTFLLDYLATRPAHAEEARIRAAHGALIDLDVAAVTDLAARIGTSPRSLERLSLRAFGFSPKLLLRRQRFLRSLAQFMLDPSLTWISTLDWQYVDQAHFVRDFKRFMGMSPSAYAALDHPVLRAAARARLAAAGEAVQALHRPG
ncbi:helix-turn-helix domain-containing protein [Novosphingobium aquiterrae]|uniref:Helix-turn-helix domain-containing protein n=1 Tax=Novosphingobium aquiterrae TaxID=624388 RepID=A0ABV6PKF7_9SPHN